MKVYISIIMALGLMFNINSVAQAQESTVNTTSPEATPVPAGADNSATTTVTTSPTGQQVERVEVIGSRIKRIQKEGTSSVKNVGKESMKNSANTTASDSLRDSSMAINGAARERSGGSAAATATIGLRGLGDTRTLVLLNGHRLPRDPSYEAVDLNLIPPSAIERIEVLKDGASALYGSDALGGVINIVTKKGYVGNEGSVKFSSGERKGGASYELSLLSGISNENVDFLATLGYTHSDKIFGKDREVTKDGLSSNGIVPAWRSPGNPWTLTRPADCPPDLLRTNSTGSRCFFRYNELATTRPQVGQTNLLTDLTVRLGSGLKLYNRNIVSYKDIEWNFAPAPIGADTLIPNGTASQPTARSISYRFIEAGNRDNHDKEIGFNTLFGLKGNLTEIWDYDVSTGYGEINRKEEGIGGYINTTKLLALINAGLYDPLNAAGTQGSMASSLEKPFQDSKSKLFTVDAVFTGEVGELENGAIGVATGASYFNEKLDQKTDENSAAGIIIGSAGSNDKGSRDVQSAFAEVSFPLTQKLELDVAGRVDHYSDFGTTFNPKLAAKYNINSGFLVRGSVGTGFKAPTLSQLYGAKSEGFPTFIDRKKCATDPTFCASQQYFVEGGGNDKLKEEKAISASVGTVVQVGTSTSFSLDGWYTKVSNLVDIDYEDMTQAELNGANPLDYGITVERDPVTGEIIQIKALNLNLASEEVAGIDLNFESTIANDVLNHQLVLENDLAFMVFDKYEGFPGVGARNVVGEWGRPKWKNQLSLSLRNDLSTYSVMMRTIPGQNIMDRTVDQKISDLNEFDISASYKLSQKSQISGGVKNIMDAKQPVDSFGGNGGIAEIRNELYDVNGRKFYVGYTQKF